MKTNLLKKVTLVAAIGGVMSTNIWAQDFENFASVNLGYINSVLQAKDATDEDNIKMNGIAVGAAYNYFIAGGFGVEAGLGYNFSFENQKTTLMGQSITVKDKFHFIDVPVRLFYAFQMNDDFSIFGFAGPKFQFGLLATETVFANDKKFGELNLYTGKEVAYNEDGSVAAEATGDSALKRFNILVGPGIGLKYKNLLLKGGYDWGLMNISSDKDINLNINQFYVSLGYAF
jgi:hypothetical protein